jgi:hypothetical protein
MSVLRQSLFVVGFVVGILLFFVGTTAGIPAGLGIMYALFKASGLIPDIELIPIEPMVVSFAIGVVVLGTSIWLVGYTFSRMILWTKQMIMSVVFGTAAVFFGYCALLPDVMFEGRFITGLLFVICFLASILGPRIMSHEAKVAEDRRRDEIAMQGYDPNRPWDQQEDGSAAFHALPDREHRKSFH